MTAGQHDRQDGVVVAGELEREDDRGERGAGRRAERRGHGDQRHGARRDVEPGRDVVDERAEQAAERAADEQDRGERAARRARSERDPPGDSLADQRARRARRRRAGSARTSLIAS